MNKLTKMIKGCSACGEDHEITFRRLVEPYATPEVTYGYSGMCEKTNIEVFLQYNGEEDVKYGGNS